MDGDVVASQFLQREGLNMAHKVIYQTATGWITIHITPYWAWQGHISDVPDKFLKYVFEVK